MREKLPLTPGVDWHHTWPLSGGDAQPWVWQAQDVIAGTVRADSTRGALLHTWARGGQDVITGAGTVTLIITGAASEGWQHAQLVADVEIQRPGNQFGQREALPISLTIPITDRT